MNKKIFLSLSSVAAITSPAIAVVACNNGEGEGATDKTDVDTSKLVASSFEITGNVGNVKIALKSGIKLPEQIDVNFASYTKDEVSDNSQAKIKVPNPEELTYYPNTVPLGLKNKDIIYIKFSIKPVHQRKYKLPTDFANKPIKIIVSGILKTDVDTTNLVTSSFAITGISGAGIIDLTGGKTLPPQVEVMYAIGPSGTTSDAGLTYGNTAPTNLENTQVVFIKFAIKDEHSETHKLPASFTSNPIKMLVSGLATTDVVTTNIIGNSFEVTGSKDSGAIGLKGGKTLPTQVEMMYAVGASGTTSDASLTYGNTAPTNLENGQVVFIKFAIKDANKNTHRWPTSFTKKTIKVIVSGLKEDVDTSKLVASSFEVKGNSGVGTISLANSTTLPTQVEVKYAVGAKGKADDTGLTYGNTPPTNLENTQVVFIKFAITSSAQGTHKLPAEFDNPIKLSVTGLAKVDIKTTDLVAGSFETKGPSDGAGTIGLKGGKTLPPQVEVKYAVGPSGTTDDTDLTYENTASNLENKQVVFIKFEIKDANKNTHQWPTSFTKNTIKVIVGGLT